MKKYSFLIAALLGMALTTACEDVPAPYEVHFLDDSSVDYEGAILPFTSANLSAGFDIYTPSDYPSLASWSTGSSYVQVTGYVDADGDGTKEYNLTQSWLISPALYTVTTESLVLNFDYTIRYANSMSAAGLAANPKGLVRCGPGHMGGAEVQTQGFALQRLDALRQRRHRDSQGIPELRQCACGLLLSGHRHEEGQHLGTPEPHGLCRYPRARS